MTEANRISIIVPVFNREHCIGQCLESILNQSYPDIEIIIIDDGSTDHSRSLCEGYGQKDNRIRIIHQANKGVSAARNTGISVATGKFVQFVDSDDTIAENMCAQLMKRQNQTGTDLVICGYNLYKNGKKEIIPATDSFFRDMEAFSEEFYGYLTGFLIHSPFNKLYIKGKITTLFDTSCSLGEDILFNLHYLMNCNTVAGIRDPLYNYYYSGTTRHKETEYMTATNIYNALLKFSAHMLPPLPSVEKGIYEIYINDMLSNIRTACMGKKNRGLLRKMEHMAEFQDAIRKSKSLLVKSRILYRIAALHAWDILHGYFYIKNRIKEK